MKTSHIFASLVLAAGLLSGCSKQAPEPAEAPTPAVESAPESVSETTPVDPAYSSSSQASEGATYESAPADVAPAQ